MRRRPLNQRGHGASIVAVAELRVPGHTSRATMVTNRPWGAVPTEGMASVANRCVDVAEAGDLSLAAVCGSTGRAGARDGASEAEILLFLAVRRDGFWNFERVLCIKLSCISEEQWSCIDRSRWRRRSTPRCSNAAYESFRYICNCCSRHLAQMLSPRTASQA